MTFSLKTFMVIGVVLPVLILAVPIFMYLISGWVLRRREILSSFTDNALKEYFQVFFQTEYMAAIAAKPPEEKTDRKKPKPSPDADDDEPQPDMVQLRQAFTKKFAKCFGISRFIVPSGLLLLITGVFLYFLVREVGSVGAVPSFTDPSNALVAVAGFAGGYMWILYSLIRLMQQRQLKPADLYWNCFRLIIAVPMAFALVQPLPVSLKLPVAFMLGAFPTYTLMTFMRRKAAPALGMEGSFEEAESTLLNLQGISKDQAEAFSLEGVGTVLQLAYADPVDLTVRTGFSFSYVVDCCSQALAWLCFHTELPKLRKYGLRGAQEICTFTFELNRETDQSKSIMDDEEKMAKKTLAAVAAELSINSEVFRRTCYEIAYDPYSQFLYEVWQPQWN